MEKISKININPSFKRIINGIVISIIITFILQFIFALVLTYTNIKENIISPVVIIISSISVLIGSIISTLNIKKGGLLNGGFIGFFYIISIYILSSLILTGFNLNLKSTIMVILSIASGMLGGIVGVNIR